MLVHIKRRKPKSLWEIVVLLVWRWGGKRRICVEELFLLETAKEKCMFQQFKTHALCHPLFSVGFVCVYMWACCVCVCVKVYRSKEMWPCVTGNLLNYTMIPLQAQWNSWDSFCLLNGGGWRRTTTTTTTSTALPKKMNKKLENLFFFSLKLLLTFFRKII